MTKYQVTAWCALPHYATFEVEARSFRDALCKARQQAADEYPHPCDGGAFDWDEFEIATDDINARSYLEPSRQLASAADDLLNAAQFTLPLLEVLACSSENRLERRAYHKTLRAVRKATRQ